MCSSARSLPMRTVSEEKITNNQKDNAMKEYRSVESLVEESKQKISDILRDRCFTPHSNVKRVGSLSSCSRKHLNRRVIVISKQERLMCLKNKQLLEQIKAIKQKVNQLYRQLLKEKYLNKQPHNKWLSDMVDNIKPLNLAVTYITTYALHNVERCSFQMRSQIHNYFNQTLQMLDDRLSCPILYRQYTSSDKIVLLACGQSISKESFDLMQECPFTYEPLNKENIEENEALSKLLVEFKQLQSMLLGITVENKLGRFVTVKKRVMFKNLGQARKTQL